MLPHLGTGNSNFEGLEVVGSGASVGNLRGSSKKIELTARGLIFPKKARAGIPKKKPPVKISNLSEEIMGLRASLAEDPKTKSHEKSKTHLDTVSTTDIFLREVKTLVSPKLRKINFVAKKENLEESGSEPQNEETLNKKICEFTQKFFATKKRSIIIANPEASTVPKKPRTAENIISEIDQSIGEIEKSIDEVNKDQTSPSRKIQKRGRSLGGSRQVSVSALRTDIQALKILKAKIREKDYKGLLGILESHGGSETDQAKALAKTFENFIDKRIKRGLQLNLGSASESMTSAFTKYVTTPTSIRGKVSNAPTLVDVDGGTSITRLMPDMVVKVVDKREAKAEVLMNSVAKYLGLETPEVHLLEEQATECLVTNFDDLGKIKEEHHSFGGDFVADKSTLIMSRVRGLTFQEVLSKDEFRNSFVSDISNKMKEFGKMAVKDLLCGNTDRLVRFGTHKEQAYGGSKHFGFPVANLANWMYPVEHSMGKGPALGGAVAIDNICADSPPFKEKMGKDLSPYVDAYIHIMDRPNALANHILQGLNCNLTGDPEAREFETTLGIEREVLVGYLEKGIEAAKEDILKIDEDVFFDEMSNISNFPEGEKVGPDEELILRMIQKKIKMLKEKK